MMKQVFYLLVCIVFALTACSSEPENVQETAVQNTTNDSLIAKTITLQNNALVGRIFTDIHEIPELAHYTDEGGSLIDKNKKANGKYQFAIGYFEAGNSRLCILEELAEIDTEGKVKYKLLDTIRIDSLKQYEYLTYCNCKRDTIFDPEIIALVNREKDSSVYNRIIKAWRANTTSGKIEPILDTKGINCSNPYYGMEECPY